MRILFLILFAHAIVTGARSEEVKLRCWIVSDGSRNDCTAEIVSNHINGVNQIFSQVCMRFAIHSISYTNDPYLANVHITNTVQWLALTALEQNTGMLELYFVPSLSGGATAFHVSKGIVVGPSANVRSISHEIGHACGLPDVYDSHSQTSLVVQGFPSKERMPDDWGWYSPSLTHVDLLKRLLMFGVRSDTKADISYGDVYALNYTKSWDQTARKWVRVWKLDNAPVGFGRHGNRCPESQ